MWKLARHHSSVRRWQSSVALDRDASIQDNMRELYGSMCRSLNNTDRNTKKLKPIQSGVPLLWPLHHNDRACDDPLTAGFHRNESFAGTDSMIIDSVNKNMEPAIPSYLDALTAEMETRPTSTSSPLAFETHSKPEQKDPPKAVSNEKPVPTSTQDRSTLQFLVYDKKDGRLAMAPFRRMVSKGVPVHHAITRALFKLLAARHCPFEAYEVLRYYQTIPTSMEYCESNGHVNGYVLFYERLCDILRYVGSCTTETIKGNRKRTKEEAHRLVDAVASDLVRLNRRGRTVCYPNFVSAMLDQQWVALGHQFAGPFYQQILNDELEVKSGWWYHILTNSKRNRQADLPFADVAHRSVFQFGIRPAPIVILHALDNLYPFTDLDSVETFLEVLLHLQNESNKQIAENQSDVYHYEIDVATLDSITAAAAQQGNSEVCLLTCSYLESLGREASEAVFENTICAFASSTFTYQQAFTVLSKMEQSVYSVQRPLIRTISTHLRIRASDQDVALDVIRQLALDGIPVSTSMLNILLSAAAERGDLGRAISLYCEFDNYGLAPNADTFSFVFEAIGKHLRTKLPRNQVYRERNKAALNITTASFVERMEQHHIIANASILRNYIEVLVATDQKEKAASIVLGARNSNILLDSKTIYLVAMVNARDGKFDVAYEIAQTETAASKVLLKNIQREEKIFHGSQLNQTPAYKLRESSATEIEDPLLAETFNETKDGEVA